MAVQDLVQVFMYMGALGAAIVIIVMTRNGDIIWKRSHDAEIEVLKARILAKEADIEELRRDKDSHVASKDRECDSLKKDKETQLAQMRLDKEAEIAQYRADRDLEVGRILRREEEIWMLLKQTTGLLDRATNVADRAATLAEPGKS